MKVYVLFGLFEKGDPSLIAVFSSRKKAVEAQLKEERRWYFTTIKEMVVDKYKEL